MPVLTPEEYRQRAASTYDPSYQIKVANANNAYNDTLNAYNQQQTNANSEFAGNVANIERNTAQTQNQYSNNTLGRGLGRSTIASTGIAGIANTGTRLEAEADAAKTQKINDLETLKTTLRSNLDATLNALSSEREGGISSLAMQLQQRDEDIQRDLDYKTQQQSNWQAQFDYQKTQDQQAQANWQAQFNKSSKSSGGGGGGGSNKTSTKTIYSNALDDLQYLMQTRGDANTYIRDNKASWLKAGLTSAQIKALQDYIDSYTYSYKENRQYTSSKPVTYGL